jgi:hypothetical protein
MAFDIKKYLTPKYLLIGGAAIVVGLIVATKFRPKSGGSDSEPETVVARPIAQPYGVDTNPDEYRANAPVTSPATPGQPGANTPHIGMPPPPSSGSNHGPAPQLPGMPVPITKPAPPQQPLPGTPRREPTPAPPGMPPATPQVPGGFPATCSGVQHRPADHPGTDVTALVRAKGGGIRGLDIVLEWTLLNYAPANVPVGLSRFASWASNPLNYVFINVTRRSRGLKALTQTELKQYGFEVSTLNAQHLGRDDKLSQADVQTLWNKWNIPYLCG